MSLSIFIGEGRVQSCDLREAGNLQICTIKVPVNTWKPGRNGEQGTETTIWCELSAFHDPARDGERFNKAQAWHERFKEGDIVSVQGNPVLRPFLRKDGEPDCSMRLENPVISKVMGQNRDAELATAGASMSEVPF